MTYEEQLQLKAKVEEITGQAINQNIQAPYDELINFLVEGYERANKELHATLSQLAESGYKQPAPKKKAKKEKGE